MASFKQFNVFRVVLRSSFFNIHDGRKGISNIGFVGLGNMGKPMVKNLLQKGFNVTVYDVNKSACKSLLKDGAKVANNLVEVSSDIDVIISMLPSNEIVLETYSKDGGIIEHVKNGTVLIDSSTVSPSVPQSLISCAKEKEAIFLDAPVSGGVIGAKNGKLTFMVGGSEKGFTLVNNVLKAMGETIVYCGPSGSGQVAKICNNLVMAITMAGLSEALNLGVSLGLDPKLLTSIINSSSGSCWSSKIYNPIPGVLENVPSLKNYEGGFSTKLLVKDLNLAKDVAVKSDKPTPLGNLALSFYNEIIESGDANLDFSVIYEYIKNKKFKNTY